MFSHERKGTFSFIFWLCLYSTMAVHVRLFFTIINELNRAIYSLGAIVYLPFYHIWDLRIFLSEFIIFSRPRLNTIKYFLPGHCPALNTKYIKVLEKALLHQYTSSYKVVLQWDYSVCFLCYNLFKNVKIKRLPAAKQ